MKLQKTVMTSAIAAAFLGGAGQALAWTPVWSGGILKDSVGTTIPGDQQIWHGGASASTGSAQGAVCDALCDTAFSVDVFEDARSVGKPAFWIIACKAKAGTGSLAGKDIIWSKRDEGGSAVGVGPLATARPVGFMKPSTGAGTNFDPAGETGTRAPVTKACGGTVLSAHYRFSSGFAIPASTVEADATADAVSRVPSVGTSDIEADKFAFTLNVSTSDFDLDGISPPTDTDDILPSYTTTGLTAKGLGILTFNTPVNERMYQDLQRMQFPTGHPLFATCNPDGGSGYGSIDDPRDAANSEMCMPSLTRSEVNSMTMVGRKIASATDLQYETTYGSGAFDTLAPTGTTDSTIQFCRRVNGSGTQAQFNAMFLGYPCDATVDGSLDTQVPEFASGLKNYVTENEGSGDVEKCLNDFNNGTNTTTKNSTGRVRWAIGVQSLEKNAPDITANTFPNDYRFIKIDDSAPCLTNVHAGDYWDYARQSMQYATLGATAATIDAVTFVGAALSTPTSVAGLNKVASFCNTQTPSVSSTKSVGWLGIGTPTSELSFSAPVAAYWRVVGTGASAKDNTCAAPAANTLGEHHTVGPKYGQSDDANIDGDQNFYTP